MSDQQQPPPSGGKNVSNRFAIDEAKKLELIGPGSIRISRGASSLLVLTCSPEDHERLEVKVGGDTLKVHFQGGFLRNRSPHGLIDYEITLPILEELKIHGALAGSAVNVDTRDLDVELDGGATLEMTDLRASDFDVKLSGGSRLTCTGAVTRLDLELKEKSAFDGSALACEECDLEAEAGSTASVRPGRRLEAEASGESTVTAVAGNIELSLNIAAGSSFRQTSA
jgi:hypothetical protein